MIGQYPRQDKRGRSHMTWFSGPLPIPSTLEVVTEAWRMAEKVLRASVFEKHWDANEEFITKLFHGEFRYVLEQASAKGAVAAAFLEDLRRELEEVEDHSLQRIASGLIATATLHTRDTERRTGGDLGVMIVRPNVSFSQFEGIVRISDYRRGMLGQAKLKDRTGRWGRFTPNQLRILPPRLQYTALLLMSYSDAERRHLDPMRWQLCSDVDIGALRAWLRHGEFPNARDSTSLINALGQGTVGTADDTILDEVISPRRNPSLTIEIYWPPGDGPGPSVHVFTRRSVSIETQRQVVRAY